MPDIDTSAPKEVKAVDENANTQAPEQTANERMFRETMPPAVDTPAAPGAAPSASGDHRFLSKQGLSSELMSEGIVPAMDKKDVPDTLARAAAWMNNRDLGVATDRNLSSGTAVSRLLQYSGAEVQQTPSIQNLKAQLEAKGWESQTYTGDKSQLKPGDLLFTQTDSPQGRNVGIVGIDGKIYSHNFRSRTLQGRDDWSSKFVTVMRRKS